MLQESDLIGLCEDLTRHKDVVLSTAGEVTRLIARLVAYHATVVTPLIAGIALSDDLQDAGAEQLVALNAALLELEAFVHLDRLQEALEAFFQLQIFDPEVYTIRPSVEIEKVAQARAQSLAAKAGGIVPFGAIGSLGS